jgi:hypothetical protein
VKPFRKVLIYLLPVAFGLAAGPAFAGLKPEPPPKPPPPPPPQQAPAPPRPAAPQPPPPITQGTSVDQRAAARLAAEAQARAARLRVQRAKAAHARAEARARAARLRAQRARAARQAEPAAVGGTPLAAQTLLEPQSRSAGVMPLALVLMGGALLLFSLAAIPARAVPWPWVLRGLDHRRGELAFLGIVALLAMAALFLAG